MRVCLRCRVSGRVQGVWYRASTQRMARELEVQGYAINLPDGRVEVLAAGEERAVKALCDWLWEGPPAAEVTDVVCEAVEVDAPVGFRTG